MTTLGRMQRSWVYGGFLAGLMLLALAPVLVAGWDRASALAYLVLPVYMLHQLEEHDDDRFRRFVNEVIGGGRELLSVAAVFWINVLGVWAAMVACLWLARSDGPGWAAFAGWLVAVNGLLHLGQGLALRRYNPGLATGVLLFLPLGALTLEAAWPVATGWVFWLSLVIVLALHLAILAHVRIGLARASAGGAV
ncbi:HXXEE domain-containing protein [Amaricoccus sp.]|uniref:HXXEE domain-containing protein n=1 Tax=Amaricoccus sp. TaxID=1872485 RepID=UPI001B666C17|nr:HXXEE domain-containing protein [Amaricoccus sp.]MBP7001229.1 HXXEE domain-containing protein [Amaricoccus sp.]